MGRRYTKNSPRKKAVDFKIIAEGLCNALNKRELGAYIYHVAATGSVYIRFEDANMGSIRLGDHDGRDKYKYKFNLRTDVQGYRWKKDGNIWRFFCGTPHLDKLIEEVVKRKDFTKSWTKKYEYSSKKHDNGTNGQPTVLESDRGMDKQVQYGSTGSPSGSDIPENSENEDILNPFELGHGQSSSFGEGKEASERKRSKLAFRIGQALKRVFGFRT